MKSQLVRALRMEPAEGARRMRAMRRHLFKNDLDHWANSFFDALRGQAAASRPAVRPAGRRPAVAGAAERRDDGLSAELDAALAAFAARRPLLVASDYDGVLARLRGRPVGGGPGAGRRRGARRGWPPSTA